jgi:hypothetical protein
MAILIAVLVSGVLVGLSMRANYRGHIEDLRSALAHERRMRKYEEERAENLSDALFGRYRTRARRDSTLKN